MPTPEQMERYTAKNQELEAIAQAIDATKKRLRALYQSRAGRAVWNLNTGEAVYGYCVACGRNRVNPNHGEDTCADCAD